MASIGSSKRLKHHVNNEEEGKLIEANRSCVSQYLVVGSTRWPILNLMGVHLPAMSTTAAASPFICLLFWHPFRCHNLTTASFSLYFYSLISLVGVGCLISYLYCYKSSPVTRRTLQVLPAEGATKTPRVNIIITERKIPTSTAARDHPSPTAAAAPKEGSTALIVHPGLTRRIQGLV